MANIVNKPQVQHAIRFIQNQYLKLVGGQPKAARALWVGMRLARLQQNGERLQELADQLQRVYPDSDEYKRYLMIRQTPGAAWK